jgi:hypothetical protein
MIAGTLPEGLARGQLLVLGDAGILLAFATVAT